MYHLNDQHKYITTLRYVLSPLLLMSFRNRVIIHREAGRRICTTFSTYHESVEEENLVTMACGLLLELRQDVREKTMLSMLADYQYYGEDNEQQPGGYDSDEEYSNDEEPYYDLDNSKDVIASSFPHARKQSLSGSGSGSGSIINRPSSLSNSGSFSIGRTRTASSTQLQSSGSFQSPYLSYSSAHHPASIYVPFEPRPATNLPMLSRSAMMMSSSMNGSVSSWLPFKKRGQHAVRVFNMPHLLQHLGLKNLSSPSGEDATKKPEEIRTVTVRIQDEAEVIDGTVLCTYLI